ncbi:hypothetical protein HUT18_13185 [Streptomyces sp. NA04227]|uniref:DUF6777 domain-containing protein n=1 Tax=Streptomyces sp. NA04227 TaxID=2742136 RepID=UPI0015905A99|nr:DUF6777 domain-containing protein [Streptomyces sp. NA04227]QKW04963.1 hypothetical protein HUT18_13185 [Streptomyces sp. NA04227]
MTSQPPPDSRPSGPGSGSGSQPPAGPPSGPLSDPSSSDPSSSGPSQGQPSHEPTEVTPAARPQGPGDGGSRGGGDGGDGGGGSGGGGGGGEGSGATGPARGGGGPWWRSAPKVAVAVAAVLVAATLIVLLTRPDDDGKKSGEVFLQPASAKGREPFTDSTAKKSTPPDGDSGRPKPSGNEGGTASVRGSAPGLYGGSRSTTSCDVEKQIEFLRRDQVKAGAFAGVAGIGRNEIPSYLRSLTPVQLRMDTRVTNHGFKNGKATSYQAVLQAGTATLVDSRGVPRVRCACGNPLTEPVALDEPKQVGSPWPGYRPSRTVVVRESTTVINVFVLVDLDTGDWFRREKGDEDGITDVPTTSPSPTVSDTAPTEPDDSATPPEEETSAPPTEPPAETPPPDGGTTEPPPDQGTPESVPAT